jgi:predicted acylesterase/phospholipase RssA
MFRILALDGGGYKGMFSAAILDRLAADLQIDLLSHFDLLAGTSTGAIIALGLAAGLTPAQVLSFYIDHGPSIFPGRRARALRRAFRSKYSPAPLAGALQEALGDRKLAESRIPLLIPAYDLCNDEVHLFRTPHDERLVRDGRERMVDVALASAAAPTFFPAHRLRGMRLIDGGVWANNPSMVAIVEALTSFGRPLQEIVLIGIGTTAETSARAVRLADDPEYAKSEAATRLVPLIPQLRRILRAEWKRQGRLSGDSLVCPARKARTTGGVAREAVDPHASNERSDRLGLVSAYLVRHGCGFCRPGHLGLLKGQGSSVRELQPVDETVARRRVPWPLFPPAQAARFARHPYCRGEASDGGEHVVQAQRR